LAARAKSKPMPNPMTAPAAVAAMRKVRVGRGTPSRRSRKSVLRRLPAPARAGMAPSARDCPRASPTISNTAPLRPRRAVRIECVACDCVSVALTDSASTGN
jgi:hypothetical protein